MSESSVSSLAIYQLRVVRCGVSPLVWRRLLVVNETSLGELREILQNAFDWSGEHLHRFFAFALLPFYLLKQQRSGRDFTHAPLFPEFPNFVQRDNGFWHTFMHQKRCFFANVLPSHSLRRRKYQVIDHHTALGLGDALSGCHREAARFYFFGTTVRCCTVPDASTEPIRKPALSGNAAIGRGSGLSHGGLGGSGADGRDARHSLGWFFGADEGSELLSQNSVAASSGSR